MVFGQFKPAQFVIDRCEAFLILRTLCHPTTFANVIQTFVNAIAELERFFLHHDSSFYLRGTELLISLNSYFICWFYFCDAWCILFFFSVLFLFIYMTLIEIEIWNENRIEIESIVEISIWVFVFHFNFSFCLECIAHIFVMCVRRRARVGLLIAVSDAFLICTNRNRNI